jgi:hypothetical protein
VRFANQEWDSVQFYDEDLQVICNRTDNTTEEYERYNFYRTEEVEETYNYHTKFEFDNDKMLFVQENNIKEGK